MELKNTFGETIKALREERDLTLREVASVLKIDISMLGKIEKNSRKPTKKFIESISGYYGVSEKDLTVAFLSDSVAAYIVDDREFIGEIFKVAEEKVEYLSKRQTPEK